MAAEFTLARRNASFCFVLPLRCGLFASKPKFPEQQDSEEFEDLFNLFRGASLTNSSDDGVLAETREHFRSQALQDENRERVFVYPKSETQSRNSLLARTAQATFTVRNFGRGGLSGFPHAGAM
jgi:hypothetical protein